MEPVKNGEIKRDCLDNQSGIYDLPLVTYGLGFGTESAKMNLFL